MRKNDLGTALGDEKSFRTLSASVPELSTAPVIDIEYTSATSGGSILNDGEGTITSKGVCWSTSPNPTTADSKTNEGSGTSAFFSYLNDLTPGTTYYLRAYAVNETGTGYGNEEVFTSEATTTPQLITVDVSDITENSAISGGYISDNGGLEVTERGICWSTDPLPTTDDNKLVDGSAGAGNFSGTMTSLESGTIYYVRSYAVNGMGTGYGPEKTFATLGAPSVITTTPYNITETSAYVGGTIFSDGGMEVKRKGIFYGTTEDPVAEGSQEIVSFGGEEYTKILSDLETGTTYYVVAFAANDNGTGYGKVVSFIPQ